MPISQAGGVSTVDVQPVHAQVFELVSTTSGTIPDRTSGIVILDAWDGGVDALCAVAEANFPIDEPPVDSGGTPIVVSSFDASRNYTLSGTPTAWPVAVIYVVELAHADFYTLAPISGVWGIVDWEPVRSHEPIGYPTDGTFSDGRIGEWGPDTTVADALDGLNERILIDNIVTVSPDGGDFSTIQAAINSITDSSSSNRYKIVIGPGTYTETITMNDRPYIYLEGSGADLTTIDGTVSITSGSAGDVYALSNIAVSQTVVTASPVTLVSASGSPSIGLSNVVLYLAVAAPALTTMVSGTYQSVNIYDCSTTFVSLYGAVGSAGAQTLMSMTTDELILDNSSINIIGAPHHVSDDITYLDITCSGNLVISNPRMLVSITCPSAYTGTVRILDSDGTSFNTFNDGICSINSNSGGNVIFVDVSSSGSTTGLFKAEMIFSGWTSAKVSSLSVNDTLATSFSSIGGADDNPFSGSGTVVKAYLDDSAFVVNTDVIDENTYISGSTNTSLSDLFNIGFSAGWVSGGMVTDNTDGTVDIAAGTGIIRNADDEQASLFMFDWALAQDLSLTDDSWNYIVVKYNSGSPAVFVQTSTPNENDTFELYEIYRDGTSLQIEDHKQRSKNVPSKIQEWIYSVIGIRLGVEEAVLGETGASYVTVSGGANLWVKLNNLTTSLFDTSGTDRFRRYYKDDLGEWVEQTGQAQFDTANYNHPDDGNLSSLTANNYSLQDFYMLGNEEVVSFYGTINSSKIEEAITAPRRIERPEWANDEHSAYIGRIVVRQGQTDAATILQRSD